MGLLSVNIRRQPTGPPGDPTRKGDRMRRHAKLVLVTAVALAAGLGCGRSEEGVAENAGRKIEASRRDSSRATAARVMHAPEPVGHSTVRSLPKKPA